MWRFDGQRANGILGDTGSHAIQLARAYLGNITNVCAHLATFIPRPSQAANDSALVTLEFESGAHALLQISAVAHVAEHEMEISVRLYGESGTLESDCNFANLVQPARGARHNETQFQTFELPSEFLLGTEAGSAVEVFMEQNIGPRLFINSILHDQPIPAGLDLYEGYKVQQVIDAALQSHTTGQRVTLL
jgi:predicted dehydrogenase